MKTNSVWTQTIIHYTTWEGSYTQGIIQYGIIKLIDDYKTFLHGAYSLIFLIISTFFVLKRIIKIKDNEQDLIVLLLSCLLIIGSYFTYQESPVNWYWFTAVNAYVIPVGLIFLATGCLISEQRKILNTIISSILLFFIAGTRLNYAGISLALLSIYIVYYFFLKKEKDWMLFIPLVALIIGIIIYVVSPGNYIRRAMWDTHQVNLGVLSILNGLIDTYFSFLGKLFSKTYFLIPLFFPLVLFPKKLNISFLGKKIETIGDFIKLNLVTFGIMSCGILVNYLIIFIAVGGWTYAERINIFDYFLFNLFLILFFFSLGVLLKDKINFNWISISILFIPVFYIYDHFLPSFSEMQSYSKAFDERIETIELNKKQGSVETLFLEPLPKTPALFHTAEIVPIEDSLNYWVNYCFQNSFQAKFPIFKKSAEPK